MRKLDLAGKRFGNLLVTKKATNHKGRSSKWECICDCGKTFVRTGSEMVKTAKDTKGKARQSCGCLRSSTTHGLSKTYLYNLWMGINQRCYNKNAKSYPRYGGRGIKVLEEWRNNPESFFAWILDNLGERLSGYSLDRIDNDGDYAPGNLRWANDSTQMTNRRRLKVKRVLANGDVVIYSSTEEAAKDLGMSVKWVRNLCNIGYRKKSERWEYIPID